MKFLKSDTDIRLLFLILFVVAIFIGSSFYYHISLSKVQVKYDEKIAKLEKIEEQLIMQEKILKELSKAKDGIKEDKKNLENDYGMMKNEYNVLRLEKEVLADELGAKPFAKVICKAKGNAECQNQYEKMLNQ